MYMIMFVIALWVEALITLGKTTQGYERLKA